MGKNDLVSIIIIGLLALAFLKDGSFNFGSEWFKPKAVSGVVGACPDDGTTTLLMRAKNPLNNTADWLSSATVYVSTPGGDPQFSEALNEATGGVFDDDETSPSCGNSYVVHTKNDGNYVYAEQPTGVIGGANQEVTLNVARSSEVEFYVFDEAGDNQTTTWVQDTISTTAEAMSSGSVLTYEIKYRAKTGSAQFGSDLTSKAPTWICIDADPTKYSKTNGVTISGGGAHSRTTDLPKYCADNGYEAAYKIPPVRSTDGSKSILVTVRADLGDPTTDVKLMFVDSHAFEGGDGMHHVGTADDASSGVGETDRYVTINIS